MDFDRSTQARSWLFDSHTLLQCRQKALDDQPTATGTSSVARVRKFASGFHSRHADAARLHSRADFDPPIDTSCSMGETSLCPEPLILRTSLLSVQEQETLVRFHAHQLSMLVGPYAVFQGLVRSPSVLATAIVFFRRFYMSNSVLDFEPRKIAVAAAFLASKVEDSIIELDLLKRATAFIERKVVKSSLGRQESYYVSAKEIEVSERELLEGLNYELRCHHPYEAIRVLAKDITTFLSEAEKAKQVDHSAEERNPSDTFRNEISSPRRASDFAIEGHDEILYEQSIVVAQNALLFSDVPFLFTPGQIAFASVAIALRKDPKAISTRVPESYVPLNPEMMAYLRARFPFKLENDLHDFESQVCKVVHQLDQSPIMDTRTLVLFLTKEPSQCGSRSDHIYEIQHVSSVLSALRVSPNTSHRLSHVGRLFDRKRKVAGEHCTASNVIEKIAKVTPIKL